MSINLFVFYQTFRDDQTKGLRIKLNKETVLHSINILRVFYITLSDVTYRWCFLHNTYMCLMIKSCNNYSLESRIAL